MKICEKIRHIEAEDVAESGGYQTKKYIKGGEKNMKATKYLVGFGLVLMLVMSAVALSATAETIGDISAYTGARDKFEAQSQQFSLKQSNEECLEIRYDQKISGTISDFKLRIQGGNVKLRPEWFDLYINGDNIGHADEFESFTDSAADNAEGKTCKYLAWENIDKTIEDSEVLFEVHKPKGNGTGSSTWVTYALYYGATSGSESAYDVDNDGDKNCKIHGASPDGNYNGENVIFSKYNGGRTDVIYEFTYNLIDTGTEADDDEDNDETTDNSNEEDDDEPEEITNTAPVITLIAPIDGQTEVNNSNEIEFIANINDNEDNEMSVFFYNAGSGALLGYQKMDSSGLATVTVDPKTFMYNSTYTWYVKVIENGADANTVESSIYMFMTMDESIGQEPPIDTEEIQKEVDKSLGILEQLGETIAWAIFGLIAVILIILFFVWIIRYVQKRRQDVMPLDKEIFVWKIKKIFRKSRLFALGILVIANIIMWALNADIIWHIGISILLFAIMGLYFNKNIYKKLREQKDKFFMMFISKEAKKEKKAAKKISKKATKKSKA